MRGEAPPFDAAARDAATMDYPGQPREKNGRFSTGKLTTGEMYENPNGFAKNGRGEKTLDKAERERYNEILIGETAKDGTRVSGISGHVYDRAAQRGISPGKILDALRTDSKVSKSDPTCYEYDNAGVRVVMNHTTGNLVSVMKRRGAR